jgi:hypothetical protein
MSTPKHDANPKLSIASRERITNRHIPLMYPERKIFAFHGVGSSKVRELECVMTVSRQSFKDKLSP